MRRESYRTQSPLFEQLEAFLGKRRLARRSSSRSTKRGRLRQDRARHGPDALQKGTDPRYRGNWRSERNMAQVDGERLRLDSNLMRARQEISKTKIATGRPARPSATANFRAELQKSQSRLDELRAAWRRRPTSCYETEVLAPQALSAEEGRNAAARLPDRQQG